MNRKHSCASMSLQVKQAKEQTKWRVKLSLSLENENFSKEETPNE